MTTDKSSIILTKANVAFYDRELVWAKLTDDERLRIKETLYLLPDRITTILNVGCGDGRVTKIIANDYDVFGVDLSMTAVKLFHGPALLGTIDALPFLNRSFDLVIATEVLEHLPTDVYRKALYELQRVADRYLLITVPNSEVLEANQIKCYSCSSVFHAWGHLHKFNKSDLNFLFCDFRLKIFSPIGIHVPVLYTWPYCLLHYLGGTWQHLDMALCPKCGAASSQDIKGNWFGSVWQKVVWRLYKHAPMRKKAFLGALYERLER